MVRSRITDPDVIARFVQKVDFDSEGCWEWTASTYSGGYGVFWTGEYQTTAHRVAYRIYRGPIGADTHIHHKCPSNPSKTCVKPDHLEEMGSSEHMQMLAEDGHKSYGNDRSDGLDADTVREIRRRAENGEKQKDIAKDLGINEARVSRVVNRKTYDHIE